VKAAEVEDLDDEWREHVASKNTEMLLVLCEQRQTKKRAVFATTHLFWDPTEPEVKLLQASLCCESLAY